MPNKGVGREFKLTKTTIDAAKPREARYFVWDGRLKGYGLRVEPSGKKTFWVKYRVRKSGTQRQLLIGSASVLTPDQAREAAERALAAVALDQDPQGALAAERAILTVGQLIDLYLAEGVATKKPTTISLDKIRLEGFVRPRLGNRKITEVTKRDVELMRDAIAAGKLAGAPLTAEEKKALARKDPEAKGLPVGRRVRGGKTAATKCVKLCRSLFRFAVGRRLCTEDPTEGVAVFQDRERDRFLSAEEVGRLGDALAAADAEGRPKSLSTVVRLLLLTGARKNEIAHLRWSEVDLDRAVVMLGDSKTGRRPIHLGAAALELLTEVTPGRSAFVFPDQRDPTQPVSNLDWYWSTIRDRAGLDGVRLHDLRHSHASAALAGGAGLPLIQKLLGHKRVATTARYSHLAADPVKALADRTSNTLAAQLKRRTGEVKPLGEDAA